MAVTKSSPKAPNSLQNIFERHIMIKDTRPPANSAFQTDQKCRGNDAFAHSSQFANATFAVDHTLYSGRNASRAMYVGLPRLRGECLMKHLLSSFGLIVVALFLPLGLTGCPKKTTTGGGATTIKIDGSSTVFLVSAAAAEEFKNKNKSINVTVGNAGTGGGFKKFVRGELDIADASRPILIQLAT